MIRTIKGKPLFRSFAFKCGDVNVDARTIPLSFSSETEKVERWFGVEILDHSPGAVVLDRLNNGGPLLENHDPDELIGVVEKAEIGADRKGRAVVRFGKGEEADAAFQDVIDGIRQHVSVGYRALEMVLEKAGKDVGPDVYRVTKWEPYEISLVSISADVSVGIGRASGDEEYQITIIEKERTMDPKEQETRAAEPAAPAARPAAAVGDERGKGVADERARIAEITAIGGKFAQRELANAAILGGTGVDAFRMQVLERLGAKPAPANPEIGMTAREKRQYSIVRAIHQASIEKLDGLEREASDAVAKLAGRAAQGFYIPQDVMAQRDLNVTDATKGGFTVGTNVLGGSMIELLRNKLVVARLGAKVLSGLVGNVAIPKVTGGATAYWLPETGAVPKTDQAFGQLGLTPKRLVGDTAYSKELVMQSSIDVESFVRDDLMRVLALATDLAAINGLGANGEPLGILNTTGVLTETFGAAATWAKLVAFETVVANANADIGSMGFIITPSTRGKWKSAPKVSNFPVYLFEGGKEGDGVVNGYPAYTTKQMPSDLVLFGNFADLIIAEWAGLDVVVDPYSLKKQGQIEVTVTKWTDTGVRHPVSFCKSTDSGAQ